MPNDKRFKLLRSSEYWPPRPDTVDQKADSAGDLLGQLSAANPELDAVYPLPRPTENAAAVETRLRHADLPDMTSFRLWQESYNLERRLALEESPCKWLFKRLIAVGNEIDSRVSSP